MTTARNETKILLLSLLLTGGILVTAVWWFTNGQLQTFVGLLISYIRASQISLGDKILVTADTNPDKEAGVQAFASGDYATAIAKFQASLQKNHNDPEALIYLNNAKAANSQHLKIAVSVPIGGNLNVAKEMLRGVAMAQDEVNRNGGINGQLLQVAIANDNNDTNTAKNIADKFVSDANILAVVGHNSSDASLAAAPVYQQGGLVMISPTSTSHKLSGIGSYIFRTVPSSSVEAQTLSDYALKTALLKNIAICTDSKNKASQSVAEEFTSAILKNGGKVTRTDCDFSNANFDSNAAVSQSISDGADALLLAPSVDKINQAIDVARSAKWRLSLLSYSVMYTFKTLQLGQGNVNGMVLTVPWHPKAIGENSFSKDAFKMWGGQVNWRSATSYDATKCIIKGLQQSDTRNGLQNALSSGMQTYGATGTIKFLPSGDRSGAARLVKVQTGNISGTDYDFVPLIR
jgi:branched-chain amino acid transport system substrate-binding protein